MKSVGARFWCRVASGRTRRPRQQSTVRRAERVWSAAGDADEPDGGTKPNVTAAQVAFAGEVVRQESCHRPAKTSATCPRMTCLRCSELVCSPRHAAVPVPHPCRRMTLTTAHSGSAAPTLAAQSALAVHHQGGNSDGRRTRWAAVDDALARVIFEHDGHVIVDLARSHLHRHRHPARHRSRSTVPRVSRQNPVGPGTVTNVGPTARIRRAFTADRDGPDHRSC